jgi:hypothetical protein
MRRRMSRHLRTSLRLFPVRPCWRGSRHRQTQVRLSGKSCHTVHGTGTRVLPSLLHVTPSDSLWTFVGVARFPNLLSFPTFDVGSELKPLPSAGITQHPQYCGPFRHPIAPGRAVAGFRFPRCIDFPLVCMPSSLPRWNRKVHLSLSSSAISAFPEIMAGRLPHHVFRGLLSVHSRYGLHTHDRGRDTSGLVPPAQIRTGAR